MVRIIISSQKITKDTERLKIHCDNTSSTTERATFFLIERGAAKVAAT
jgi:hypothetical protein